MPAGAGQNATVKNKDSGVTLTLALNTTTTGTTHQAVFFVVPDNASSGADEIAASHGDELEIKAPGTSGIVIIVTVDAEGPDITVNTPSDGSVQTSQTVTYGATVTDPDSGMRPDSEGAGGDGDSDGLTTTEPLADGTGAALDINVFTKLAAVGSGGVSDQTQLATSGWTDVTNGFSIEFSQGNHDPQEHFWFVEATDRAGNTSRTDADDDEPGDQNEQLTVDNQKPIFTSAETGTGWDPAEGDDGEPVSDDAGIWLAFENETSGLLDKIDEDTVQISDFIIFASDERLVSLVIEAVYVDDENVYLILTEDLAADAEPDIQMLAGVISDKAGNANNTLSTEADIGGVADKIAPTFTVTITGDTASRPVAAEELTVRVDSNEPLVAAPIIYFVDFEATPTADDIVIAGVANDTPSAVTGSDTRWQEAYEDSDMFVPASGLIGFIVLGTDANGNDGVTDGGATAGTPPLAGDALDIEKMNDEGLLAELDAAAPTVTETLLPGTGSETEATNPFIRLAFAEADEYSIGISGETNVDQDGDGEDKVKTDGHNDVTITAITLDGDDISGAVARIDDETFNVATAGLSLGDHTLAYTAEDAVGNDADFEFDFEVIERSEYEVSMSPGWNLVSLPGTPVDSDLDSVLPDSMKASRVLQWVDGAFEVNERGSDGTWDVSGGVTELVA